MAWGEIKVEEQRKAFIEAYLSNNCTKAELFRQFQICPRIGYKWIDRFNNEGFEGLKDRSRARLTQASTDPYIINQILALKFKNRKWGPKKIRGRLLIDFPEFQWPSTTTIGNIFDKNGLTVRRKLRRRVPGKTVPLFDFQQPNDTWCADFKGWFLTKDGTKCDPFTLTDALSRYILRCIKLDINNTEHVWAIFDTAFREYGMPLYVRHDNGPPFGTCGVGRLSQLSIRLIKAGVIPEWIDLGKPYQNGSHERMHLTLQQETATPPADNLEEQKIAFENFQEYFNEMRPHEALGQKTPSSIYIPSNKVWSGRLQSPEYSDEFKIRRVCSSGKISWKDQDLFLGRALSGEPVGIKEHQENTLIVYYGPIILGSIDRENNFKVPEGNKRRKYNKKS